MLASTVQALRLARRVIVTRSAVQLCLSSSAILAIDISVYGLPVSPDRGFLSRTPGCFHSAAPSVALWVPGRSSLWGGALRPVRSPTMVPTRGSEPKPRKFHKPRNFNSLIDINML
jgi:hypothetical protein